MDSGKLSVSKIKLLDTQVGIHKIDIRQKALKGKEKRECKATNKKLRKSKQIKEQVADALQITKQTNKISQNSSKSTITDNSNESKPSNSSLLMLDDAKITASNKGFGYQTLSINNKFTRKSKFYTEHLIVDGMSDQTRSINPQAKRIRFKRTDMLFNEVPQLLDKNNMIENFSDSMDKGNKETKAPQLDVLQEFRSLLISKSSYKKKRAMSMDNIVHITASPTLKRSLSGPRPLKANVEISTREALLKLRSLSSKLMKISHGHCISYHKVVAFLHKDYKQQLQNQDSYKYFDSSSNNMSFKKLDKSGKKDSLMDGISATLNGLQQSNKKPGAKKGKKRFCLLSCF